MVFIDSCIIHDLNIMFKQNVYRNILTTVVITNVITTLLLDIYDFSQLLSLLLRWSGSSDVDLFVPLRPMNEEK